mgnify:CR=1 FL=1
MRRKWRRIGGLIAWSFDIAQVAVAAAQPEKVRFHSKRTLCCFAIHGSWPLRGLKPITHAIDSQSQQRILHCDHLLQHHTAV